MRFIPMEKVKPGMVSARAVFDSEDRILLGAHVEFKQEFINNLKRRGYSGVYIEDKISHDIHVEEVISGELRRQGVRSLKECNLDGVLTVAKDIVKQILTADTLSLDLVDLRSFDDYTYSHSVNVAVLSCVTGMEMQMNENELLNLCVGAIFHDLGKSRIDAHILNKPDKLTAEEYEEIKKHSMLSYNMVRERYDISATSKKAILCHHENEDGSGYPLGLSYDAIHIFAKIIHVMDVYDALTAKRPYKEPYAASEALEYLMGGCGILFDKKVVDAFSHCAPVYPKGMEVRLSDGREGIVIANHKENILRPEVRLFTGETINLCDEKENRNITIMPLSGSYQEYGKNIVASQVDNRDKKHILIVDDLNFDRRTIRGLLENQYRISTVESGKQAIEFLSEKELPDLILMDIEMPGLSGIDTVKWIRSNIGTQLPVIFVTGHSDEVTIGKCRALKASDFIVKPFKPVYIQECIRKALMESMVV